MTSRVGSGTAAFRSWLGPGAVLLLALAAPTAAQELRPGAMPIGVRITLEHDDYLIGGVTAPQILDQLRALGPRRGWTAFPYVYSWRYRNENIPLTNGMPSNRCRPVDFELRFEVTATYPRWSPSPEASDDLVAAWEAFSQQLTAQWEQIRGGMVERARQAEIRVRRYEDQCAYINNRVEEMVVEIFNDPDLRGDDEPRIRLQWPPDGFEQLMRPEVAPEQAPEAGSRGDTPPMDDPAVADRPDPEPEAAETDAEAAPAGDRREIRPAVNPARDIDTAVELDFDRNTTTGLVVDLHHESELQFREAFGTVSPESDDVLEPEARFGFPSFTEVLIATLATSLAAEGTIDLQAPVSTYLPDLSPALGATTLDQMLDHRAGLDNAMVPDSADWSEVMDRLNDRALFTEPGAVYSQSRYSYPLAARVLEGATGVALEDAISETVLGPLGLDSTRIGPRDAVDARDGLPVTYTNVVDLTTFWTAWIDGEISGWEPDAAEVAAPARSLSGTDGRMFGRGFWRDRVGESPRISLMCGASPTGYAAGIQVLPDTRTIMVFWSRYDRGGEDGAQSPPSANRWPRESVRFVLSRVAEALQLTDEVYRPTALNGGGQPGSASDRCAEPSVSQARVADFGPNAPTGDWAGRYLNGEWFFALEDRDGELASPIDPSRASYSVRHYDGDVYFTDMDLPGGPMIGFQLQLFRDDAGRRYVRLGNRTYLHEEDRGR